MALWDRQPEETSKAYGAFCAYRDIRTGRTVDRAYQQHTSSSKKAARHWWDWYEQNDWRRRAEAYDAFLELQARERRETEHLAELDAFRKRQKQLAVATIQASIGLLQKSNERLKELDPEDIEPNHLPAFFRAAAAVAEAGTNAEASALAVEELLKALNATGYDRETDDRARPAPRDAAAHS